jgi:macrolide transport system ATP-binding/permease protein
MAKFYKLTRAGHAPNEEGAGVLELASPPPSTWWCRRFEVRAFRKTRLRFRSLFRRRSRGTRARGRTWQFHLDQQIEENLASGMAPDEARKAALCAIGGFTQYQRGVPRYAPCKASSRISLQDLRFGLPHASASPRRSPRWPSSPWPSGSAPIRPSFPWSTRRCSARCRIAQPDRLITLGEVRSQQALSGQLTTGVLERLLSRLPRLAGTVEDLRIARRFHRRRFHVFAARVSLRPVFAVQATTNFFSTLGVKPFLGRDFRAGEDAASGPYSAILTYGFLENPVWRGPAGRGPLHPA